LESSRCRLTRMARGVPELGLPCRDSGINRAKPDRRADKGGNDLDQAASRSRGKAKAP
jgi:hypothetical protein